jgi:predicted outer membrane protein
MISREHVALQRDAQELAEGLRLTERTPAIIDDAPASFRVALDSSAAGAAWDRAYIEYAIAMHEAAMENTARALAATRSPAVRDYVRKSVPILQKHLDKARSIQKAMIEAQPAQAPDRAPARQDTNGD